MNMHVFYYSPAERYLQNIWFNYVKPAYNVCASVVSYPLVWSGLVHGDNDSRKVQTRCAHCGAAIDVYMSPEQYKDYLSQQRTISTPIVQSIGNSLTSWLYRNGGDDDNENEQQQEHNSVPITVCDHHCLQNYMAAHNAPSASSSS